MNQSLDPIQSISRILTPRATPDLRAATAAVLITIICVYEVYVQIKTVVGKRSMHLRPVRNVERHETKNEHRTSRAPS
jgi:hypothetical protein